MVVVLEEVEIEVPPVVVIVAAVAEASDTVYDVHFHW